MVASMMPFCKEEGTTRNRAGEATKKRLASNYI